ncbi:sugar phosphate isomerase/epimerase family protein [Paenibacillus cymbidii]|uniref:sugar phosphate isomerase/epimerase family protein n=1 Tax=Paenibacillus cymbidii TaxID=1639034 RepID=UPI0014369F3E|nr:sugar phosphate isomerase/epimerase family protein [Paenibacillus cymbidii]
MNRKLKYAFMSFSSPELSLPDMLAAARSFGYAGIEPRVNVGHRHGIEYAANSAERRTFRQAAETSGIRICCLATGCKFADPAKAADNVSETIRAITLAADIGCPRIRVFGGDLPPGVTHDETMPLIVDSLAACASEAEACGVTICLETHDAWSDPRLAAQVAAAVNHPAVGINWDIAHPVRYAGVSVEDSFHIVRPWLRHVHVHDGIHHPDTNQLEFKAMGQGTFDHLTLIRLLQAASYDGYVSGEWIGFEPFDVHLPREIEVLREYEQAK